MVNYNYISAFKIVAFYVTVGNSDRQGMNDLASQQRQMNLA